MLLTFSLSNFLFVSYYCSIHLLAVGALNHFFNSMTNCQLKNSKRIRADMRNEIAYLIKSISFNNDPIVVSLQIKNFSIYE